MPAAPDLEKIYDEHAQALFAFLLNFTRDENDTRDVLQEIFTRLARDPGLLRGARDERAAGRAIPAPRSVEAARRDPDIAEALADGAVLALATLVLDTGKPARANVSLDSGLLAAIDEAARENGVTYEPGHGGNTEQVHYRAFFDDKGRMMVLICHNTDLGDGWEEEGVDPWYFQEFASKRAYPMGVNIIFYAMTH